MKDGAIKILGLALIALGILGFLILGTNIVGFSVSDIGNNNLEISEFDDITLSKGDSKLININAKNIGDSVLTNCALILTSEKQNWINSDETKNIPADSNMDFNFKLNIPEDALIQEYPLGLQLSCDQSSTSIQTSISITNGVDAIKIRELSSDKNFLNIIYTFDNQGFIGESTYVEIWVNNPDGFEINRIKDQFSINNDNLIVRDVKIDLKENPKGVYAVFMSHPTDSKNYIKKSVILGKSKTSGNAIFNVTEGKGIPYLGFLLFIAIGTFFIFRSHRRSVREANEPISITPKLKPIR